LPEAERRVIQDKTVRTSFLQHLPFVKHKYRSYLPLMPIAVEQFDLSSYDLILSSSHSVAKGVLTTSNQIHICYCHTPMRYAWDLYHQYLREAGLDKGIKGRMAQIILHYIRMWDYTAAQRVDYFIANSKFIASRIKKNYNREAVVIYPPIDTDKYQLCSQKDDYYVTASRLVPYKKVDLIVEAFSRMPDKKLVVIGDGPDLSKVKSKASKNIELLGYQQDSALCEYLQKAKAFVFAAEEDFGILPVEAQACGTPVIAYGKGGVVETVNPFPMRDDKNRDTDKKPTGVFFDEQTIASLSDAVFRFEKLTDRFDCRDIRKNAEQFGKGRFKKEFKTYVDMIMTNKS
jgi:glycosyltransferase involved in cell wall biosynthesis